MQIQQVTNLNFTIDSINLIRRTTENKQTKANQKPRWKEIIEVSRIHRISTSIGQLEHKKRIHQQLELVC